MQCISRKAYAEHGRAISVVRRRPPLSKVSTSRTSFRDAERRIPFGDPVSGEWPASPSVGLRGVPGTHTIAAR